MRYKSFINLLETKFAVLRVNVQLGTILLEWCSYYDIYVQPGKLSDILNCVIIFIVP